MLIDRTFLLSHLSSTFSHAVSLHLCLATNTETQGSLKGALETDTCAQAHNAEMHLTVLEMVSPIEQNHSTWQKTKMQPSCQLKIGNISRIRYM